MKFTPILHKLSNGVTVLLDPMSIVSQGADYTGNLKEIWEENFKSAQRFPKDLNLPGVPKENKLSELIPGEKCR